MDARRGDQGEAVVGALSQVRQSIDWRVKWEKRFGTSGRLQIGWALGILQAINHKLQDERRLTLRSDAK